MNDAPKPPRLPQRKTLERLLASAAEELLPLAIGKQGRESRRIHKLIAQLCQAVEGSRRTR